MPSFPFLPCFCDRQECSSSFSFRSTPAKLLSALDLCKQKNWMKLAFCWQVCRSCWRPQLMTGHELRNQPAVFTGLTGPSSRAFNLSWLQPGRRSHQACYWYHSCVVHPSLFSCRQKFLFAKARTFFTGSAKGGSERFFALRQISGRVPANSEPFASEVSWPVFPQVYIIYNNWQ